MVLGLGLDVASVPRIARLVRRYDDATLSLVFTDGERARAAASRDRDESLAICFAGKEAVGKAIGTGLAGIGWNEIEIERHGGTLEIALSGDAAREAVTRCVRVFRGSWSRANDGVVVMVIASSE